MKATWATLTVLAVATTLAAGEPQSGLKTPKTVVAIESESSWFDVYDLGTGVYAMHEPGHWERVLSYLILGDERALLFDTGTGIGDLRAVVTRLTELPIVVVNSHSHPDHVGGNHQFETIYGVDTDYGRERSAGLSIEDSRRFVPERAFNRQPPLSFSRDTYRIHPYRISRFLDDGERIDLGGRELEVVLTPGHSPDSLCLLDREHRFLLTGDIFYLGRLIVTNLDAYVASASRLAGLRGTIDRLLPAHSATLIEARFLAELDRAFQSLADGAEHPEGEATFGKFSIALREGE